jgi:hypothetical protein
MAWTESHQELANHPKTRRLCRSLGITRVQAIGHLHLLWWWAMDYAQDGDLSDLTPGEIADACDWEGDPDQFVCALQEVHFLDHGSIHDWDEYGGKYFKRQELARERQRRHRTTETAQPSENDVGHALVTRESRDGHALVTRLEEKRGQEKREEERTQEDTNEAPTARVRAVYRTDFEVWWKRYPTGFGNKKQAGAQWERMTHEERRLAAGGLDKWLGCERWSRGFVKAAEIWLRDRWWENDPPDSAARASPTTADVFLEAGRRVQERHDERRRNGQGSGDDLHALLANGQPRGAQREPDGGDVDASPRGHPIEAVYRERP